MREKITIDEFIKKSKEIHGERYNYSLVKYVNCKTKVKIICTEHGEFEQSPEKHLMGQKCKLCSIKKSAEKRSKNIDTFLNDCKKIHGNKYDYSKVEYFNSYKKIKIICPEHGEFEQTPTHHANSGYGCQKCGYMRDAIHKQENPVGWNYNLWESASKKSKNFNGFKLYIIECWNDNERFYKIGKTFQTIEKRFKNKITMPYNYKIIKIINGTCFEICKLENDFKNDNKENKYLPNFNFCGRYECFSKLTIKII